jgi:hypothetical protein
LSRVSFSLSPDDSKAVVQTCIGERLSVGVWLLNVGADYTDKLEGPFATVTEANEKRNNGQYDYNNAQYLLLVWPELAFLCSYRGRESLKKTHIVFLEVDTVTFEVIGIKFIGEDGMVIADHPECQGQLYESGIQYQPHKG